MLFQVSRDASFGDTQVFCHAFLQQAAILASAAAAKQIADADAQRLAGLNIVVRHLVGVGKQQDAWTGRRLIGIVERRHRARQQPP
jgi:hypothetical protein